MACDYERIDNHLSCDHQLKMYAKGYVMTYDYKYVKREKCNEEIMSDNVDWCHVHNSKRCLAVRDNFQKSIDLDIKHLQYVNLTHISNINKEQYYINKNNEKILQLRKIRSL